MRSAPITQIKRSEKANFGNFKFCSQKNEPTGSPSCLRQYFCDGMDHLNELQGHKEIALPLKSKGVGLPFAQRIEENEC